MTEGTPGQPAPPDRLVDVPRLVSAYYTERPDPSAPGGRVSFGTSGHRGSALHGGFQEEHVLAIAQAVCDVRRADDVQGPLFLGVDTHALSEPARRSVVEVFAANGVDTVLPSGYPFVPTPVVSHAILTHNRDRGAHEGRADGVVLTPSHNPPEDGGFKYNPPHGGPAGTELTRRIEARANELLRGQLSGVKRWPYARAAVAATSHARDMVTPYVDDLGAALDLEAVKGSGLRLGADPLGGATGAYWSALAERWGLDLEVVNDRVDPTFAFMPLDGDGKIRMDCSSPHAMAGLIGMAERFDVAFGADPDGDRHGIVTRRGLMNPNHYLAVAVDHLFRHRPAWPADAGVGKTLVSSGLIDRVAADLGRPLVEVPVGFKWFVEGLASGAYGFGGEESAGASFLRRDGRPWTTDKDGMLLSLLAAEITAVTGEDPSAHFGRLAERHGVPHYRRSEAPADEAQKTVLSELTPAAVRADTLAGEPIEAKLTRAPGNDAPIGGLKVVTRSGWFAARPSGTEAVYKIYAESFRDEAHLQALLDEARTIVQAAFDDARP